MIALHRFLWQRRPSGLWKVCGDGGRMKGKMKETRRRRTGRRRRGGGGWRISGALATLVLRQPPRHWMSFFIKDRSDVPVCRDVHLDGSIARPANHHGTPPLVRTGPFSGVKHPDRSRSFDSRSLSGSAIKGHPRLAGYDQRTCVSISLLGLFS